MAFITEINGTQALFGRLRKSKDVDQTLEFVRNKSEPGGVVVFIDIAPNEHLVRIVEILCNEGYVVFVIDHHYTEGEPINEFERNMRRDCLLLHSRLGDNARITTRREAACCLQRIDFGEFKRAVIVADGDADGLTSSLWAVGVLYDGLPRDALLLDGSVERKLEASENGLLLLKTLMIATDVDSKSKVFSLWVEAVQGNASARAELESRLPQWQVTADVAKRLSDYPKEVAPGVLLVDTVGKPRYDPCTLAKGLVDRGCTLFVVRQKQFGEFRAVLGDIAYRMDTVAFEDGHLNVREFLEAGYDPTGIIVHGTFRLWVSEKRWYGFLLPALQARFQS